MLQVNNLIGFGAGGPVGPVAITRTADGQGTTTGNTGPFITNANSFSIGAEDPGRIIVLAIGAGAGDGSRPTDVTINTGSGAVAMNALSLGYEWLSARLFWLSVPTGTTATFSITWDNEIGSAGEARYTVYRVTGGAVSSHGSDSSLDMDSTDPLTTGSITIPENGGFIAVASGANDLGGKAWANATEDLDLDAGLFRHTTATRITAGTVTVTCTGSNGEDGALAWVIFNPA